MSHQHTNSLSPYYLPHIAHYINFKMINLTHIISILNFVFTIVVYAMRWIKLISLAYVLNFFKSKLYPTYICFDFLN
jgi:hypothetical protein